MLLNVLDDISIALVIGNDLLDAMVNVISAKRLLSHEEACSTYSGVDVCSLDGWHHFWGSLAL